MKTILKLICFSTLLSFSAMAEFDEVQSLNQGSCWFKEVDNGVKVSSFSDGVSAQLNDEYLSSLNNLNLPVSFNESYSSQLFCGGHGLSLVMNVKEGENNYCLWFKVSKSALEVQSIGLTNQTSNCDGYRPGRIIVTLAKGSNLEEVSKTISEQDIVDGVEVVSKNVLNVTLVKKSWGQEDLISKDIESIKEVKFAEKSFFYHPIGEWGELNSLKKE